MQPSAPRLPFFLSGLLVLVACSSGRSGAGNPAPAFTLEEATIESVHRVLASRRLTCRSLIEGYLRRIEAYNLAGPALTAIVTVNEHAVAIADSLDRRQRAGERLGPLHCIPFVVKDNIATEGVRTTVGSAAFAELVPRRDAFAVRRIREAGGVILAKGHLSEFAVSYWRTAGSILPGETRNPYALDYTPAGSSGGVAAAVAANLALAGLASETGKSIRGPSAYTGLVGLRSTIGLVSTRGVAPMRPSTVGPMTRTVADMAAVLTVLAGVDPEDPGTVGTRPAGGDLGYSEALGSSDLKGVRIAIVRQGGTGFRPDTQVLAVFERALDDLRKLGAILIDSLPIDTVLRMRFVPPRPPGSPPRRCSTFKYDLDEWLDGYAPAGTPRFAEVLAGGRLPSGARSLFEQAALVEVRPDANPDCAPTGYGDSVRTHLLRVLDGAAIEAMVYPTWVTSPSKVGGQPFNDTEMLTLLPHGASWPSLTIPMGYGPDGSPQGLELMARAWQESRLLRIASAYERNTRHRCPPASAPPLAEAVTGAAATPTGGGNSGRPWRRC